MTQPTPPPYGPGQGPPQFSGGPPSYVVQRTNPNAIISLVTSILSWVLCPVILAVVGLVTGTLARRQIRESNGTDTGDGIAIAGIVISILNLVLFLGVVILIALIAVLGSSATSRFSSVGSVIG